MHDDQFRGGHALAERPALPLDGPEQTDVGQVGADEFDLDVRVLVTLAPIGQADCPTDDGCGNTCSGSASSCNSAMNALS